MRETCLDCARKHLAQADILMMEEATGDYPTHKWYAVGHMAEAADELMAEHPDLAAKVRGIRLGYMDDHKKHIDIAEIIELIGAFDKPEFTEEDLGEGIPGPGDEA